MKSASARVVQIRNLSSKQIFIEEAQKLLKNVPLNLGANVKTPISMEGQTNSEVN